MVHSHPAMGQAPTATLSSPEPEQQEPLALVINKKNAAIPEEEEEALEQDSNRDNNSEPLEDNDLDCSTDKKGQKAKQRNYKNMTRERRNISGGEGGLKFSNILFLRCVCLRLQTQRELTLERTAFYIFRSEGGSRCHLPQNLRFPLDRGRCP